MITPSDCSLNVGYSLNLNQSLIKSTPASKLDESSQSQVHTTLPPINQSRDQMNITEDSPDRQKELEDTPKKARPRYNDKHRSGTGYVHLKGEINRQSKSMVASKFLSGRGELARRQEQER